MKNVISKSFYVALFSLSGAIILSNCSESGSNNTNTTATVTESDSMKDKGIGPVTSLTLGAVDNAMAEDGKKIYESKCTACHNPTEKLIGPPQKGVLERRTPEWVMNMMLNPQEMLAENPIAKKLLKEYNNVPMTAQGLTEEDARKVLEYLRTL
ncbi:MAG: cytochrome c [Bacteroidota bacterium]